MVKKKTMKMTLMWTKGLGNIESASTGKTKTTLGFVDVEEEEEEERGCEDEVSCCWAE